MCVYVFCFFMWQNLVNLVGYCCEGGERLLAYEFVANGNLKEKLASKGLWTNMLCMGLGDLYAWINDDDDDDDNNGGCNIDVHS